MSAFPPERSVPPCHFVGRHPSKIDDGGRMSLPAPFRRALPDEAEPTFILRQSTTDSCIQLIPIDEWRAVALQRMGAIPAKGRDLKWQQRKLFGEVEESSLDPKGRLVINPSLLQTNGISGEALVVGVGKLLELWDPARYDRELETNAADPADVDDLLYG